MFRQAVAILQATHEVAEMAAYEMLVHQAVQAGTTVREVARTIVEAPTGT